MIRSSLDIEFSRPFKTTSRRNFFFAKNVPISYPNKNIDLSMFLRVRTCYVSHSTCSIDHRPWSHCSKTRMTSFFSIQNLFLTLSFPMRNCGFQPLAQSIVGVIVGGPTRCEQQHSNIFSKWERETRDFQTMYKNFKSQSPVVVFCCCSKHHDYDTHIIMSFITHTLCPEREERNGHAKFYPTHHIVRERDFQKFFHRHTKFQ